MELIKNLLKKAKKGEPVFITDVRKSFNQLKDRDPVYGILYHMTKRNPEEFIFMLPKIGSLENDERKFVSQYFNARIYNILSSYGGKRFDFFYNTADEELDTFIKAVEKNFGIDISRRNRFGFGRCINVTDRLLDALLSSDTDASESDLKLFSFSFHNLSEKPSMDTPVDDNDSVDSRRQVPESILNATKNLDKKSLLGADIGGTDIKLSLVVDGRIAVFKEYDWFPASFTEIDQIIDPIILLIGLMRIYMHVYKMKNTEQRLVFMEKLAEAINPNATEKRIRDSCNFITSTVDVSNTKFDGIGLCFPDVVIRNKIVGGEVYKTRGIRNNPAIDYEVDFKKLTNLEEIIKPFATPNAKIRFTNDGPMAAFTAAVEMAASDNAATVEQGIFAFTLGTELGTGWLDERGEIPEIPLEVYNYIIDLGSYPEIDYEPDEARSINNFNTGLPGTLQKYTCQSGVFRLALKYFPQERPDLLQELFDEGFLVEEKRKGKRGYYVPVAPTDMRKPLLKHLMSLPDRENCEVCMRIFREVGMFLGITCMETDEILHPSVKTRILFGRLVKNATCFQLMQEGAREIAPGFQLVAADSDLARTRLMKQLRKDPYYTVAQFAQAIGAVYFANA